MRYDSKSLARADGSLLSMTFEQFKGSSYSGTSFGELFLALTEETAWSSEYLVRMKYPTSFIIAHQSFQTELEITDQGDWWANWTVRRVEDAVREHFGKQEKLLEAKMAPLQEQMSKMYYALQRIDKAKARAALAAAFPEAAKLAQFMPEPTDIFCFGERMDRAPTYLVRMVNHEPIGGIARLWDHSAVDWHMLLGGTVRDTRLGYFWTALAQAFAARQLQIPETELRCAYVDAMVEDPWDPLMADRYTVKKVVLRASDDRTIIVTFGGDNLPAKAEFKSTQTADS